MDFRHANRTDIIVVGVCLLFMLVLYINTFLDSIIPVYIACVLGFAILGLWGFIKDPTDMLKRSLIIGWIGGFFYTFIDRFMVEMGIITYLRQDVNILATPLSIVFVWMYFIAMMTYLYQRFCSRFGKFYIPTIITSVSAFAAILLLDYLADQARLWVWNTGIPPSPSLGNTPLFVPIGFGVTFLLSPYIIGGQRITRRFTISGHPIAAGLRCAILMSVMVYMSYHLLVR
ncbi:hypothetical protein GF312_08390 [Candidatus Poribacteria bacterium]|nr:hypothetical protein [Candidatus Poribacteria bacterium]